MSGFLRTLVALALSAQVAAVCVVSPAAAKSVAIWPLKATHHQLHQEIEHTLKLKMNFFGCACQRTVKCRGPNRSFESRAGRSAIVLSGLRSSDGFAAIDRQLVFAT